ncbi:MAG: hypothetical protein N3D11_09325 [Candidatus Sumerlaeia bacterium]|nr:hypothetical protein [Candidatus Sumerlaeia bacterium]
MSRRIPVFLLVFAAAVPLEGGNYRVSVRGNQILLNNTPVKIIGLRCSNALISDAKTQMLLDNLDVFKSCGVNTVSVYFMGSRFGDVKGYRPDASLDPVYAARMARIIEAADRRGMIVLVGCLYWSDSRAKEDLDRLWTQADANRAVANTVRWLREHEFRNVIVDPDNEGMAVAAKKWSTAEMIDAGHAADPRCVIGNNCAGPIPPNADVLMHYSAKDGVRPWFESEGSPSKTPQGYWGAYSKEPGYYNYIRIGRYTPEMKVSQIEATRNAIARDNGYMLASTWLQCGQGEGIGGPFMTPGGRAENANVDEDVKTLRPDAGILWWLEFVKQEYGPWNPPPPAGK